MSEERATKLDLCPVCQRSYWILTKYRLDAEHASVGWRASCHGCSVSTFRCTTKTEALSVYKEFRAKLWSKLGGVAGPYVDEASTSG